MRPCFSNSAQHVLLVLLGCLEMGRTAPFYGLLLPGFFQERNGLPGAKTEILSLKLLPHRKDPFLAVVH